MTGNLQIGKDTGRYVEPSRIQEFPASCERNSVVTSRTHQTDGRHSDGLVVVDDGNHWNLCLRHLLNNPGKFYPILETYNASTMVGPIQRFALLEFTIVVAWSSATIYRQEVHLCGRYLHSTLVTSAARCGIKTTRSSHQRQASWQSLWMPHHP